MQPIIKTELFAAMQRCGRYDDDADIIATIQVMREWVENGADPEETLLAEGFEPDYVFDLL